MRSSIVIAAHNEGESLAKTVRSVIESTTHLDYEIIVADDASFDDSVKEVERRFLQVRVVRHEERKGASPAKHLGARNARGEVLVFLDGHTKPETGAIKRLVEDVEWLGGQAVVTPAVPALDTRRWQNRESQVGHGYRLTLEKFDCGWLPLSEMKQVGERGRKFYESPALIGCALAVSRELYDDLWGFDSHMLAWGVEDLDFGLKCWLLGRRILHDPEAIVGHRFCERFDNYDVPFERLIVNQLRMARKNFTRAVWSEWVERCRKRHAGRLAEHPEGLWARAWSLFEAGLASADEERAYLLARRVRDEFWYAERFGLAWPKLQTTPRIGFAAAEEPEPSPSPSPSPCPVEIKFSPNPVKLGFTKPVGSSEMRRWVEVTIEPHAAAAAVTFKITGQPRATIFSEDISDQDNGKIRVNLKGVQQMPSIKPKGDTWLEATHGGMVCGKLPIIVVVPKKIGTPHPEPSGAVAGANLVADRKSSPVWWGGLLPTQVIFASIYPQWLVIQVNDQFDAPLHSIYAGLPVEEFRGLWRKINQDMSAGGTYLDPVGPFLLRGGTEATARVLRDSAAAGSWPTDPVIPLAAGSQEQNIKVRVAGHELSPSPAVKNRTFKSTLPSNVEIDWPD